MRKGSRVGTSKNVTIVTAKEESLWQSLFVFFLGTCVCVFLSSTIVRMCVFLKETTRELRVEEERESAPTRYR